MRYRHATAMAVAASALALTPARADAPACAGAELARALARARPAAARVRVDSADRARRAIDELDTVSRRFPGSAEATAADLEASRLLETLFRVNGRPLDLDAAREHLARVPGCQAALHAAELWAESGQDLFGAHRALRELAVRNAGQPCGRAAAQSASMLAAFDRREVPPAQASASATALLPAALTEQGGGSLSPLPLRVLPRVVGDFQGSPLAPPRTPPRCCGQSPPPLAPPTHAIESPRRTMNLESSRSDVVRPPAPEPRPTVPEPTPGPEPVPHPASSARTAADEPTIERIAVWPEGVSTRIAIYLDRPCRFVKIEEEGGLRVRLAGARIARSVPAERTSPIGIVRSVRAAPRADGADVVLEVGGPVRYRLFPLAQPYRIVLDVARPEIAAPVRALSAGPEVRRIVIDAGHGGHDPGALGASTGVQEKVVTLEIATTLARLLRERLGVEVILTRKDDQFVPLEERTARANGAAGDLFVSIHVNAALSADQAGVETFVLARSNERDALRIAARENRTDLGQVTELGTIFATLGLQSHQAPSEALAACIQERMVRRLTARFGGVQNRGVRRAMFYVLVGAHMPAVLVETSFLTNPTEEARLAAPEYRRELAEGIYEGIAAYVRGSDGSSDW